MFIMKKNLKNLYLSRLEKLPKNAGKGGDFRIRKMRKKLHEEFDRIWVRYNQKKATYSEWNKALEKWLSAECI